MINSEAARVLFGIFFTAGLTALGFTVKGAIMWGHGEGNGKTYFLVGLAGVIIAVTISAFLYIKGFSVTEEPKESENIGDIATTEIPEDKEPLVSGKSYEGGTYTGEIDPETKKPDGSGKMYYSDGNIYDGNWKNGLPDGTGVMTYKNGDTYSGNWKNGKRDGYGTYTWQDNRQYTGYYKNGLRDGQGEFTGWTGFTKEYGWSGNYIGTSKEDYFDGEGSFIFENGDQFNGVFRAGQFWDGIYTYSNGTQLQITDGVPSA